MITSTFFASFGLAADRARNRAMQDIAGDAETTLSALYRRRMKEAELVGPLEDMASVHESSTNREIKSGFLSRTRGKGRVSANISGLKQGFSDAAEAIKRQTREVERSYKKGNKTIANIYTILDSEERNTDEKARLTQKKLASLNPVIIQLESSALPRVESIIDGVERLYMVKSGSAKMERARLQIKESLDESKNIVLEKLSDLESTEEIFVKTYRVPDAFQAIFEYWPYVAPAFGYALACDVLIPVLAMFFVSYIARERPQQQKKSTIKEDKDGKAESEHNRVSDINSAKRLRKLYKDSKAGGPNKPGGNGRDEQKPMA